MLEPTMKRYEALSDLIARSFLCGSMEALRARKAGDLWRSERLTMLTYLVMTRRSVRLIHMSNALGLALDDPRHLAHCDKFRSVSEAITEAWAPYMRYSHPPAHRHGGGGCSAPSH